MAKTYDTIVEGKILCHHISVNDYKRDNRGHKTIEMFWGQCPKKDTRPGDEGIKGINWIKVDKQIKRMRIKPETTQDTAGCCFVYNQKKEKPEK